jgi:cystathionine gamma-synthase
MLPQLDRRINSMAHESERSSFSLESLTAQALGDIDTETRAIIAPIHTATTYVRDPDNEYRSGRMYGRADNPTFNQAEALISTLEGAQASLLFASGMAAATAVFLALEPGDHVVASEVMYWALRNWLVGPATRFGLRVTIVDTTDPEKVRAAIQKGQTRLVWVETPGNPLWSITDIAQAARDAHDAGAKLVVDSTAATPVWTRPLELGADIVMHSATKYLNGHSDVLAGMLSTAHVDQHWQRIVGVRSAHGGIAGPFEAWLLVRGMRTLFLRVREASRSALRIAEHFHGHPRIVDVLYPGLPHFPGHAIARRQMAGGFGGMLSIRVQGGEERAIRTAARVRLWKRATSLGGVESLVEHRASVEGPNSPVPNDLLRLSVGIESAQDLIDDLERALAD